MPSIRQRPRDPPTGRRTSLAVDDVSSTWPGRTEISSPQVPASATDPPWPLQPRGATGFPPTDQFDFDIPGGAPLPRRARRDPGIVIVMVFTPIIHSDRHRIYIELPADSSAKPSTLPDDQYRPMFELAAQSPVCGRVPGWSTDRGHMVDRIGAEPEEPPQPRMITVFRRYQPATQNAK